MHLEFNADIDHTRSRTLHYTAGVLAPRLPFYLESWGHYFSGRDYFLKREALPNFQLLYCVQGSGLLTYRGRQYLLQPRQLFLINCDHYHYYCTGPDGFWEMKWIHFGGLAALEYFNLINGDGLNVVNVSMASSIESSFTEIAALITVPNSETDIKLVLLITAILSESLLHKKNPVINKHACVINEIIHYMQQHYPHKIQMDDLWRRSYLSKYHFLRVFKQYTGFSPYQYLTRLRINISKSLLNDSNLSIQAISEQIGFRDINNYIREFKKLIGTTPLKYRRQ